MMLSSRARVAPLRRAAVLALAVVSSWGALAAPATAPAGAAAVSVEPYQGVTGGPRLAVIGDSITYLSHGALHAALDPGFAVSVDGQPGYTVVQQEPVARVYAGHRPAPEVVNVNLGTNDASRRTPLGVVYDQYHALLANFPTARCLVLTTVNANTMGVEFNHWANEFNFWVIYGLALSDTRVRIADWNTDVRAYYDAGEPDGSLTTDLVHPTGVGQARLAALTADAVASCPA